MRRRVFNLAAVASAGVCLAVCVLWVRSYFVTDTWEWFRQGGSLGTTVRAGEVRVTVLRFLHPGIYYEPSQRYYRLAPGEWPWTLPHESRLAGFSLASERAQDWKKRTVGVPLWAVMLVTAALPAVWARQWWRRPKPSRRPGVCYHCGYDLRASRGRCPECGSAFEWVE